MLKNISRAIFTNYLWPKWTGYVTKSDSPKIWKRAFIQASQETKIISLETALRLSKYPSIMRLMFNTFKADRNMPSAEDFAVSIAFEVLYSQEKMIENCKILVIDLCQIRNFSCTVRKCWLNIINGNPIYKIQFKENTDKHPADYLTESASCTTKFDSILNDRLKLYKAFYGTYNTYDATEKIKIWLPNENGYVDYSDKSFTVEVQLNAAIGADLGFARVGFDYSLEKPDGELDWMKLAIRDNKKALETMGFNKNILSRGSNCIWAK